MLAVAWGSRKYLLYYILYVVTNCFSVVTTISDLFNPSTQRLPGPWGVPILGYLPFLDPKVKYYI